MIGHNIRLIHQGVAPGVSMCNGGGGGTDTPDSRYKNLDQLYGVQAQAAQYMLNNAMPHIPKLTQNSSDMVDEAMSGALATRARNQAGADASQAFSANLDAVNRNTARYGADFNANRMAALGNDAAVGGALAKANAMNQANQWAEDQKWNRNANFYGQVMGMNNGAMSGMSNAGAGMLGIANQQSSNAAANAAGFGTAGAAFGAGLMRADGGNVPAMATGGNAWEEYKAANPIKKFKTGSAGGVNPILAMASGAAPGVLAAVAKDLLKDDSKIQKWWKDNVGAKEGVKPSEGTAAPAAPTVTGAAANVAPPTGQVITPNNAVGTGLSILDSQQPVVNEVPQTLDSNVTTLFKDVGADTVAGTTAELAFAKDGGQCLALGGMPSLVGSNVLDQAGVTTPSLSLANMNNAQMPVLAQQAPVMAQPTNEQKAKAAFGDARRGYNMAEAKNDAKAAEDAKANNGNGAEANGVEPSADVPEGETAVTAGVAEGTAEGAGAGAAEGAGADAAGGYGSVVKAAADIASGRDASTAVADAAAGYAGAEAGATIGSAVGPVGTVVGGVVGGILGGMVFKDGGRTNYQPGGKVKGPGTETSDSVPAWLSKGEVVHNADAVKLAGEDALLAINNEGKSARYGKKSPAEAQQAIGEIMVQRGLELSDGAPRLANGGNLGIAMGAATQQWNQERQAARQDEILAMQKQSHEAQMAAASRAAAKEKKLEDTQLAVADKLDSAAALDSLDMSHMTPGEQAAARAAYKSAGYAPTDLRRGAVADLSSLNVVQGRQLGESLGKEAALARKTSVGEAMARGDVAGALTAASGDKWSGQQGLELLGTSTDKKTGAKSLRIGQNGKEVASIDQALLGDYLESTLDPSQLSGYSKGMRELEKNRAEQSARERQIGISAGNLALAQQKGVLEMDAMRRANEAAKNIQDLRASLSTTTDPVLREAIKQRIEDLTPVAAGDKYRYHGTQAENDSGRKVTNVLDSKTGAVYENGVPINARPAAPVAAATQVRRPANHAEADAVYKDPKTDYAKAYPNINDYYAALGLPPKK